MIRWSWGQHGHYQFFTRESGDDASSWIVSSCDRGRSVGKSKHRHKNRATVAYAVPAVPANGALAHPAPAIDREKILLEFKLRVAELMIASPDERLCSDVLELLTQATESPRGAFGIFDAETVFSLPEVTDLVLHAAREKAGIWSVSMSGSQQDENQPVRHITFPILADNEVIGAIQVFDNPLEYTAQDRDLVEYIARAAAPVLQTRLMQRGRQMAWARIHAELNREIQELGQQVQRLKADLALSLAETQRLQISQTRTDERARVLKALVRTIGKLQGDLLVAMGEDDVVRICLSVAQRVTRCEFCYFGQATRAGKFDMIAFTGQSGNAAHEPVFDSLHRIGDIEVRGLWGLLLRDEQLRVVNDPAALAEGIGAPESGPVLVNLISIPLKHGGRAIGVLALANKPMNFDDADAEIMEALAPVMVAALIHKRGEFALRDARKKLSKLDSLVILEQLTGSSRPDDSTKDNRRKSVRSYFKNIVSPANEPRNAVHPDLHRDESEF